METTSDRELWEGRRATCWTEADQSCTPWTWSGTADNRRAVPTVHTADSTLTLRLCPVFLSLADANPLNFTAQNLSYFQRELHSRKAVPTQYDHGTLTAPASPSPSFSISNGCHARVPSLNRTCQGRQGQVFDHLWRDLAWSGNPDVTQQYSTVE